jgi:Ca2+-binding RTX toxin-like protein
VTTPPLVPAPSIGVNRIGSEAADVLIGTDYEDMLDGRGGADSMTGGLGDDVYIVDSVGDKVLENPNAGNDTIKYIKCQHFYFLILKSTILPFLFWLEFDRHF